MERTTKEIDDVRNKTIEAVDAGTSKWPGMTYEQGVEAALAWVVGDGQDPMEEN